MPNPRIVSLIPSATEIVYLLGLGDFLVARSHDSNYPEAAMSKPAVTATVINSDLSSKQIDEQVRSSLHRGTSIFHINQKQLAQMKPNLILTQELCDVCAPSFTQIKKAARVLTKPVKLLSLEPKSLEDVFENILLLGMQTKRLARAKKLVAELTRRLDLVSHSVKLDTAHPSVVIVEWLDPIMIAGHWVPEMVERAGGAMLLSKKYEKSRRASWHEISLADPDVLVFAPCGFNIERARKELDLFTSKPNWNKLRAVRSNRVYFVDGNAYLTRSGPRLVDGVEILAKIFHPEIFREPNENQAQRI